MAWSDTWTTMLRVMINDLGIDIEYCDLRLQQVLVVAAAYVQNEHHFSQSYTINIGSRTISPDPTVSPNTNDDFSNLTVLKAACIIDQGKMRDAALVTGVKAVCGPARLDVGTARQQAFKTILEMTACKAYEELSTQYRFGKSVINLYRFVLSPFGDEYDLPNLNINAPGSFINGRAPDGRDGY
jgi:hypothetical protein